MTLLELSKLYTASADAICTRILELQAQLLTTMDPRRTEDLRRRITELQPLLRDARNLAHFTAHYYDRNGGIYGPY